MTDKVWVIVSPEGGIGYNIFTGRGKCFADEKEAKLALDSKNEWSKANGYGKYELLELEVISQQCD